MSIVLEDGTGLSTSETYISVADCDLYHTARAQDSWSDGSDDEKEAALRRAMAYLEGRYGPKYTGVRRYGREQALMWPRSGATDAEGWVIDIDVIPIEVVRATAEAALRELAEPGFLSPDVTAGAAGQVIREKNVVGPIETETEYSDTVTAAGTLTRPLVQVLDDILSPLLRGLGGSFGSIPIERN